MATTADQPATQVPLSGRLGRPNMDLRSDPRSDPRMVEALTPFGLDVIGEGPPIDGQAPIEAKLAFCDEAERGLEAVFDAMLSGPDDVAGPRHSTETIPGGDGNEIQLYIARPQRASGPLPCILHIHGGGMTILRASGKAYVRLRDELAATGLVVVGVEFRNAAGALGNHPFPAGLSDCAAALNWVHANRAQLGVSKVVLAGESGGANLSLATALEAKRDGRLGSIDGVYALVRTSRACTARQLRREYWNSHRSSRTTDTSFLARSWTSWRLSMTPALPTAEIRFAGPTTRLLRNSRICPPT